MLDWVGEVNMLSNLIGDCYNGGAIGLASVKPIVFVEGCSFCDGSSLFRESGALLRAFVWSP